MADDNLVTLKSLLYCLLECSEKASSIAHVCREDDELFKLLIEEKSEKEKNKRFVQDFKTLADVLVQETVRWEVSKKFPALKSNIFGEENSSFKNTLGETVKVEILNSTDETATLLSKVLDGADSAATALACSVFKNVHVNIELNIPDLHLFANKIGIWIDPIDSTGEYVHSKKERKSTGVHSENGLQCVCILIGAYSLDTGYPILGVINQPFHCLNLQNEWENMNYWGLCYNGCTKSSITPAITQNSQKTVVVSSSEDKQLLEFLKLKYKVCFIAGAGYKCLLVARGDADLYILSHPTTYFWDTCGPQAILMACGGSVIDFKKAITMETVDVENLKKLQLKYSIESNTSKFCNVNGIIAFNNSQTALEFVQFYQENFRSLK